VVVEGDDARVGDGDAEYVSCKIAQDGLVTLAPMVDVDDPGLGPGGSGPNSHLLNLPASRNRFARHRPCYPDFTN
jgi:hypothetical protein